MSLRVRLTAVAALGRSRAGRGAGRAGRRRIVQVRLDDVEAEELARRAAGAGVSGPRYLVEAALLGGRQTVSERRAVLAAFMVAKRQVSGAATNLNQLARVANSTGKVPAEVLEAAERMGRTVEALEAAAARVEAARP